MIEEERSDGSNNGPMDENRDGKIGSSTEWAAKIRRRRPDFRRNRVRES